VYGSLGLKGRVNRRFALGADQPVRSAQSRFVPSGIGRCQILMVFLES
jgi:hypothetical protein